MDALNQIVDGSAPSTWKALFISICYYSTLPFVTVFTTTLNVLLVVSSPLIHLLSYVAHLLLLPLSIVGKLETLYVYFGVAALIGLLTGAILYFVSNILASIFDINSENGRVRKSASGRREGTRRRESPPQAIGSISRTEELPWYGERLKKESPVYLGKGSWGKGLSSQIIMEEDSEGSRL